MRSFRIALALSAVTIAGFAVEPSLAQTHSTWQESGARLEAHTRTFYLAPEELRMFKKIRAALAVDNHEGAAAAIAAAKEAARTEDGKYAFAALELELGLATGNVPLQNRAVEAVLATGVASKGNEQKLERRHGLGAIWEADYDKAEATFTELLQRTSDKPDVLILLAETKYRANRHAEALQLLDQAIALETAAKRPIPPRWLKARQVLIPKAREEDPAASRL